MILRILACLLIGGAPAAALAHLNGVPTTAWPGSPHGVGAVSYGDYTITWTDYDDQATTGETTIDVFVSRTMPPTYRMGTRPRFPADGDPPIALALGIAEDDLENAVVWDTSSVPPGTWFVWTVAHDEPFEMVAFARGVVSVAREGGSVWPAVIVTSPDASSRVSDASFLIRFEAFDPDQSAAIRLEASRALDGVEWILLAEGLPAEGGGSFLWDTRAFSPGDWMIRATIEDARGLSTSAYGRFFVRIDRGSTGGGGIGGKGGSGGSGAGGQEPIGADGAAGAGGVGAGAGGAGGDLGPKRTTGGGCASARPAPPAGLAVVAVALLRRRWQGGTPA